MHADAEWHDNIYGDEVKSETEKCDGMKPKNCWLVVLVCKSGMLFQCKSVLNCGTGILYVQLAGRFYGYAAEVAGSVRLKL